MQRRRRGVWMYDAGVSVQQSARASSPSRACVDGCWCGCNYDDSIIQVMRRRCRCCRFIKRRPPRKRRNKGWRWSWWWQMSSSRRKRNSGVDLVSSSTRAFASSLAPVLLRKGTGPAFFGLPEAFISIDRVRVIPRNGLPPRRLLTFNACVHVHVCV